MSQVSTRFQQKLARELFAHDEPGQKSFLATLTKQDAEQKALLWLSDRLASSPFESLDKPAWVPGFVQCPAEADGCGRHQLHQQGSYYIMDLSSVFCCAPLTGLSLTKNRIIFDMCSAPGGKGIFAFRLLKPAFLFCNELIEKRIGALHSNLKRCSLPAVAICNSDPSFFGRHYPGLAELVLADVPCSGQSLFARGFDASGCFHPATINKNSNRQKRILAEALKLVAPGGYLLYSTCTYSKKENEQVIAWALKKFRNFEPCRVEILQDFESRLVDFPCYRLFPHQGMGSGGFCCLLRNTSDADAVQYDINDVPTQWRVADR